MLYVELLTLFHLVFSIVAVEKKSQHQTGVETKETTAALAPTESKTSKKKKKKDKASKAKDFQEQVYSQDNGAATGNVVTENDTSAGDMKERLKKMASGKKKKSNKEMDTGAKVASQEAAARSARLAAAKKKEKNHYNQQPMR